MKQALPAVQRLARGALELYSQGGVSIMNAQQYGGGGALPTPRAWEGGPVDAPLTAPSRGSVQSALEAQDETFMFVGQLVLELARRLDEAGLLRPPSAKSEKDRNARPPQPCALAERVMQRRDQLEGLVLTMRDLHERFEG